MPSGIYKHKSHSEKTRRKISVSHKGIKHSEKTKQKLSLMNKGKHFSSKTEFKTGQVSLMGMLGKHHSEKTKKKMSEIHIKIGSNPPIRKGIKNNLWKGGITLINQIIRHSLEYKEWRKKVFERDNYTCKDCGKVGDYLNADHIKRFADYPELRFELSNGKTLCISCHKLKTSIEGKLFWLNQYSNLSGIFGNQIK